MIELKTLPTKPGCYLYKDTEGTIIYVGKAKNIKKRVSQYFSKTTKDSKTQLLVKHIKSVETFVVNTEIEALLLESRLIKQHKPKFNIDLKHSERYAYIQITNEEYPRLRTIRHITKSGKFYGPFTDGTARRNTIELCKRLFKIRSCKVLPKRECLYFHIGQCSAPCINLISKEEYLENVKKAELLLQGKEDKLIDRLTIQMHEASTKMQFEHAKIYRDQIFALEHIKEKQSVEKIRSFDQDVIALVKNDEKILIQLLKIKKGIITSKKDFSFTTDQDNILEQFIQLYYSDKSTIPDEILLSQEIEQKHLLEEYVSLQKSKKVQILTPQLGEKKELVNLAYQNALNTLNKENPQLTNLQELLRLIKTPTIIECFDMSTLFGTNNVGACVQFKDGRPNKEEYRHFNIKSKTTQDDFNAMHETVYRRYLRQKQLNQLPDLIVIDGGPGQLNAAHQALTKLDLTYIPLIGLAKKQEEIYTMGRKKPFNFDNNLPGMKLLINIRDEVHRYVVSFHRKKRAQSFITSELDTIPGLGNKSKEKLFENFKTVAAIKKASLEELKTVLPQKLAREVFDYFNES